MTNTADIVVVGAGPAGLAATLALGITLDRLDPARYRVICAGPPYRQSGKRPDPRTTALMTSSVAFMENLGVWKNCKSQASPLEGLRIIDATGGLLRGPDLTFRSDEIQDQPFGYNIANSDLVAALHQVIADQGNIELIETAGVSDIEFFDGHALLKTQEGQSVECRLIVGADGRNSLCRSKAKIGTKSWAYDQAAIACNFEHSLPHDGYSNEFHTRSGPFTTVPLHGANSSLVWVVDPDRGKRVIGLSDEDMAQMIEENLQGLLGPVRSVGPRAMFPLSGQTASRMGRKRVALLGEAAHVIPPIGAQGLNLSFRDAAWLSQAVFEFATRAPDAGSLSKPGEHAETRWKSTIDFGSSGLLEAYHESRMPDIQQRTIAVDLLNRSLLSEFIPVHLARGLGLHLLDKVPFLRQAVMKQGLAPQGPLPDLMSRPPENRQGPARRSAQ